MAFSISEVLALGQPYMAVYGKYKNLMTGDITPEAILDISKTLNWGIDEPQAASIVKLIQTQDFEGPVSEFVMSGKLLPMLLNKAPGEAGSQLIRCTHCDQLMVID